MTMYRIQSGAQRLQRFRSTELGSRYREKDLEDWLEQSPEVLTNGEPVLIIGRQVPTALGGTLDLLALDANGATVVIELKRAPTPRDIVAQALEYATWVAGLDDAQIRQLAEGYLSTQPTPLSFELAWQQAFGGAGDPDTAVLPEGLQLDEQQRILVVIEGANERVSSVVQYLRSQGLDISLLEYRYYETEGGQEILDLESVVGRETVGPAPPRRTPRYTEERVLAQWSDEGRVAYSTFRDCLLEKTELMTAPQKSAISFYKQTRDGRVFICYFRAGAPNSRVGFRLDSLQDRLDVEAALASIRANAPSDVQINAGNTWCVLHFPSPPERATEMARIISEHIATKVE